MAVFWVVAPLVEVHQNFRCAFCFHHQDDRLMTKAAGAFETSVSFYQTRNKLEDSHLYTRCRENLKYHI
jgi:hypothetical protein